MGFVQCKSASFFKSFQRRWAMLPSVSVFNLFGYGFLTVFSAFYHPELFAGYAILFGACAMSCRKKK